MMISVNKALYLSFFSFFSFTFSNAQTKVPFGVVKAEEGYAMVRVPRDNYRKIVDKIRMRKGDVFVYVKPAEGETDWLWIKYPEKPEVEKSFIRFENLDKEGMVNKDRIVFIDKLPHYTPSMSKNGKSIIFTDLSNSTIPDSKRNKVIIDIYPSIASYRKTEKDADGKILTVDKTTAYGIDGAFPEGLTEIKSVRVQQIGRGSVFLRDALKNMFQPSTNFDNIGVAAIDNDNIFLYMTNGSGAGRYTSIWTIREGKAVSQIVYKNPE